jgi:amidohydrolase
MASSDSFRITIKGKSAHGAQPQKGIDAIVIAAQVIQGIQNIISRTNDPTDPAVITIGKITGGTRANILAEEVVMDGTVRTINDINRDRIEQSIKNVVKSTAASFGADYTIDYNRGVPSLYNHPELAKTITPTLFHISAKKCPVFILCSELKTLRIIIRLHFTILLSIPMKGAFH